MVIMNTASLDLSVFLLSVIAFGFSKLQESVPFFSKYGYVFVIFALFILFLLSYRKQVNYYIVKQIDEVNNNNINESNQS